MRIQLSGYCYQCQTPNVPIVVFGDEDDSQSVCADCLQKALDSLADEVREEKRREG